MDIDKLISPERVVLGLGVAGKGALLQELARRVAPSAGVDAPAIAAALSAREHLGSTGLGRGFALPHARIAGLTQFVGLFARLSTPIAFDAIDAAPVDLVFLLLIPGEPGTSHLSALAAVSRLMRDDRIVAGLRGAEAAAEAYALLTQSDVGAERRSRPG